MTGTGPPGPRRGRPDQRAAEHVVTIAGDGTISIVPPGQGPETTAMVGRIKLVNPPEAEMTRGEDGLFRMTRRRRCAGGCEREARFSSLETSNVNAADAMVNMIELARQFDLQVKAMRPPKGTLLLGAASARRRLIASALF